MSQSCENSSPDSRAELLLSAAAFGDLSAVSSFLGGDRYAYIAAKGTGRNGSLPPVLALPEMSSQIYAFLDIGMHPDMRAQKGGKTALMAASERGSLRVVRFLLLRGASTALADAYRQTALMLAVKGGHVRVARALVNCGAVVNISNTWGQTPLLIAAEGGYLECVRLLADRGGSVDATHAFLRKTAVAYAAAGGHSAVVGFLLSRGAKIDSRDVDRCTPLMRAAENGHAGTVSLLIDNGADMLAEDEKNDTALLHAIRHGHVAAARVLLERGHELLNPEVMEVAMVAACEAGCVAVLGLLMDIHALKFPCRQHNRGCKSPLHGSGGLEGCKRPKCTLLESKDLGGKTKLMTAAQGGHTEAVVALLEWGADVKAKNDFGTTALMIAAERGFGRTVEALVKGGAGVNEVNAHKRTALHLAAMRDHVDVVKVLGKEGCDPLVQDADGKSCLSLAAERHHWECYNVLTELVKSADKDVSPTTCIVDLGYKSRDEHHDHLHDRRCSCDDDADDDDDDESSPSFSCSPKSTGTLRGPALKARNRGGKTLTKTEAVDRCSSHHLVPYSPMIEVLPDIPPNMNRVCQHTLGVGDGGKEVSSDGVHKVSPMSGTSSVRGSARSRQLPHHHKALKRNHHHHHHPYNSHGKFPNSHQQELAAMLRTWCDGDDGYDDKDDDGVEGDAGFRPAKKHGHGSHVQTHGNATAKIHVHHHDVHHHDVHHHRHQDGQGKSKRHKKDTTASHRHTHGHAAHHQTSAEQPHPHGQHTHGHRSGTGHGPHHGHHGNHHSYSHKQ